MDRSFLNLLGDYIKSCIAPNENQLGYEKIIETLKNKFLSKYNIFIKTILQLSFQFYNF